MEKKEVSPKEKRQRKFMLVLPLIALPFLTLMFWALGGGEIDQAQAQDKTQTGFNINLPDANLKDEKKMDKMSYYDKAAIDSVKFNEMTKNDPNFRATDAIGNLNPFSGNNTAGRGLNTSLSGNSSYNDSNTAKIYQRLELLNRELNKPQQGYASAYPTSVSRQESALQSADVERLEQMMQSMSQTDEPDPEMQQLTGMLEKILDIQHPERVQEKLKENSRAQQGKAFTVTTIDEDLPISLLDKRNSSTSFGNGFFSLEDSTATILDNAIPAVVHETQTLVNGSIVKLRLQSDIYINGIRVPKDSFIFGTASLSGERLSIEIKSLRFKKSIFPVELEVFDMDGLDGIHIPGAITRDVAKQSADQSTQNIGLNTLDASWGVQAAGAGIEAAKTLFSKKIKLIKVTVKAGYQVLLRDGKQKQSTIELTNNN